MKKYIVFDMKNGDEFTEVFDTQSEAEKRAARDWDYLTESEKKKREYFYVGSAEVDEDGEIDYETIQTIKTYK